MHLPQTRLDGTPFADGELDEKALLIVNVASRCGLAPQYAGLEALQRRFGSERFTVLGVPCNQFAGQEPGTPEEIQSFCSATYGTTFPLAAKTDVNGVRQDPLYRELTAFPDAAGEAGEVQWNFEKFLLDGAHNIVARFRPTVEPESDEVIAAIERVLA